MSDSPRIALIATLDTKGDETAYVRDRIGALGGTAIVIDSGILGEAVGCEADVPRGCRPGGRVELDSVRAAVSRGAAVAKMRVRGAVLEGLGPSAA